MHITKQFISNVTKARVIRVLEQTKGQASFEFDHVRYKILVSKVFEVITQITIATLPHSFPDSLVRDHMIQYGTVIKIDHTKYSDHHIYKNAYTGLRIVHIRRKQVPVPLYAVLGQYRV